MGPVPPELCEEGSRQLLVRPKQFSTYGPVDQVGRLDANVFLDDDRAGSP